MRRCCCCYNNRKYNSRTISRLVPGFTIIVNFGFEVVPTGGRKTKNEKRFWALFFRFSIFGASKNEKRPSFSVPSGGLKTKNQKRLPKTVFSTSILKTRFFVVCERLRKQGFSYQGMKRDVFLPVKYRVYSNKYIIYYVYIYILISIIYHIYREILRRN